jgi:hypothetical protein
MLEVADVFRLHGAAYRARFGDRLLPSHTRAMQEIAACRTAYFGGHLKQCDHCSHKVYVYHSCRNRHCPKCHRGQTERWLSKQHARLLPCRYFLLTFTLPSQLRALARSHPKQVYGLLMRCAAAALQKLSLDPRYLGAHIGCLAVLHTWTRAMLYHPHVHLLVTGGGLSADATQWIQPHHPAYLVPVQALSIIFRAKVCAALNKAGLLQQVTPKLWKKNWVVHCQPAGCGQKVLDYLGRYVFRIAITNSRLERMDNGQVTFRYRDKRTPQMRHLTLPALDFIGRFLQHVLPQGCAKVRYYGICSSSCRTQLDQAQTLLGRTQPLPSAKLTPSPEQSELPPPAPQQDPCPHCRIGHLIVIEVLLPNRKVPP